ncbi:MAG: hypothetical protein A2046_11945 [Bacteroidetes bacterium GWA2_30_7]|nr:MAG: hypothetical protein A2046_11945 [Bacteroidetes bacterium GWA2_30_7]
MKIFILFTFITFILLWSIKSFTQPRFLAFNVYQFSSIKSKPQNGPKLREKNIPYTFTAVSVGNDRFLGGDFGMIPALLAELAGKSASDYKSFDAGFLSMYGGKQVETTDDYTIGIGLDMDIRALGAPGFDNGMYTLGPVLCTQYRINKIVTYVCVLGAGIGTGWEIQWRNSISVGYGKVGFNLQPDLNFYKKKGSSITTRSLRLGISFRLD